MYFLLIFSIPQLRMGTEEICSTFELHAVSRLKKLEATSCECIKSSLNSLRFALRLQGRDSSESSYSTQRPVCEYFHDGMVLVPR